MNEYLLLSAAATATTPQVDVYLEHHQNKHQHKNSMIAEIGTWKAKKGSLFASGKGLQWHRTNTAVMVRNWALSLGLVDGQSRTLKKAPLTDGYIYDASASRAGGVVNGVVPLQSDRDPVAADAARCTACGAWPTA